MVVQLLGREDKIAQMYSSIQTGASQGMQTMDQCLTNLVNHGVVFANTRSASKAQDKNNFGG